MTSEISGNFRDWERITSERTKTPAFPSFRIDSASAPRELYLKILSLSSLVNRPLVIGVVGASGSGKTVLTDQVESLFSGGDLAVIESDVYALPRPILGPAIRMKNKGCVFEDGKLDNENPAGYRLNMLLAHVERLRSGSEIPLATIETRGNTNGSWIMGKIQPPNKGIVLEGLSILELIDNPQYGPPFDFVTVLDYDPKLCFIRRMIRDTSMQYWIKQDFGEF
ncbi:MAG: hypothetical protein AAB907_00930, partial [Patescibacteria group bacterium]